MRLLHTSDWHLGRQLHGVSLLPDQAHVLAQIVDIVREEAVDVVAIAGDIYDRSVPPAEAVELLGATLRSLCLELGRQVVLIAGNHDGPERLGFAAELLVDAGLHIAGPLRDSLSPVTLALAGGELDIFCLPYAGPATVRQVFGEAVSTHEEAMAALLRRVDDQRRADRPSVVMAHCFVDGGEESDSERPLSLGGADRVPAALFEPYTYTALGHLHRPQQRGAEHIRYSGSILKYSFSEAAHRKSVTLVDIAQGGDVAISQRELTPLRELRVLEGPLDTLLRQGESDPRREDYICARLTDTAAQLDVMGKLRALYPNVLQAQLLAREYNGQGPVASREMLKKSHLDLFGEFFEEVQGEPLARDQADYLKAVLDTLHAEGGL
ncbi:exonuclease SbcCD subunit D [Parahaliea mediterranea]|uniref:Nuclease SbcCD subunit D n=1 Tax=Parahaliea mediterranea TaxID=651086 RepID=A0A939DGD2_9GAMM|nr:exonuclease SbcCD subunit D [Parahaliea mediterranea]MBN7797676.1 exonuclease SbcCD subunit D [Parahaliea mediterranea]